MSRLFALISGKCPNCEMGRIYQKSHFFSFSKMEEHCAHCDFKYEKEPGYFIGAMYFSYGLVVAELAFTLAFSQFFFEEAFDMRILLIMLGQILLLAPFNYRMSRVLWLYIFNKRRKREVSSQVEENYFS